MNPETTVKETALRRSIFTLFTALLLLLLLAGSFGASLFFLNTPPEHFAGRSSFTIEPGEGVKNIKHDV